MLASVSVSIFTLPLSESPSVTFSRLIGTDSPRATLNFAALREVSVSSEAAAEGESTQHTLTLNGTHEASACSSPATSVRAKAISTPEAE